MRRPPLVALPRPRPSSRATARWPLGGRNFATSIPDTGGGTRVSTPPPENVAVLGGGLTGLTAAYVLARELPLTSTVTLYEARDRLGGWIETVEAPLRGGGGGTIRFELGPRLIRSLGRDLGRFSDLAFWDIQDELRLPLSNRTNRRALLALPDGRSAEVTLSHVMRILARRPLRAMGRAVRISLGVLLARFLPFLLPRCPPPGNDISVGQALRDLTGSDDLAEHIVSALMHGVSGGRVDRQSLAMLRPATLDRIWARPGKTAPPKGQAELRFADWELVTLVAGRDGPAALARESSSLNQFALDAGMGTLPESIERVLRMRPNVKIRTGAPVRRLDYDQTAGKVTVEVAGPGDGSPGSRHSHDAVISTLLHTDLAAVAGPDRLPSLETAPAVSIGTVNLWYDRTGLVPDAIGLLVPSCVSRERNPHRVLGIMFDHVAVPRPAAEPEGTKLFVLMGGHYYDDDEDGGKMKDLDEAGMIQAAREGVAALVGIPVGLEPRAASARLARCCIPQLEVGHLERMADAHDELLAGFGGRLAVAGPSYTEMGVLGAIRAGWESAMRLAGRALMPHLGSTGLARFGDRSGGAAGGPPIMVDQALVRRVRDVDGVDRMREKMARQQAAEDGSRVAPKDGR